MLLSLNKISSKAVDSVRHSFEFLPETDHKDGKFRLRRYGIIYLEDSGYESRIYSIKTETDFIQSSDYNKFQGDIIRRFSPIEDSVVQSIGMSEMCDMFKREHMFSDDIDIEVHQMRIRTLEEVYSTPVSPEGAHQDGYDGIGIFTIDRFNIQGGHLLIYRNPKNSPFLKMILEPSEACFVNDRVLWHNADDVKSATGDTGWMDAFILTAKRSS
jgi:hypothetical protein